MHKKDYLILVMNFFLPISLNVYTLYLLLFDKEDTLFDTSLSITLLCLQFSLWSLSLLIDNDAFSKKGKSL